MSSKIITVNELTANVTRRPRKIEAAEQLGHVCLKHAGRFCLTASEDGQTLALAADILTEARFMALGMATDSKNRQRYIDRFVAFVEQHD